MNPKLTHPRKSCVFCGKEFIDDSPRHHRKACSQGCSESALKRSQKTRWRKLRSAICEWCGSSFETQSKASTACSNRCSRLLLSKAAAAEDQLRECFRAGISGAATKRKTGIPGATISRWFARFRQEETDRLVAEAGTVIGDDSSVITDPAALSDLMAQLLTGRLVGDQDGRLHTFDIDR